MVIHIHNSLYLFNKKTVIICLLKFEYPSSVPREYHGSCKLSVFVQILSVQTHY